MRDRRRLIIEIIEILGAVLAVAVVYWIMGCPIKLITGVSCPGCGMTRACRSLVKLRFDQAFAYHPLIYWLPFFVVAYLFLRKTHKQLYKIVAIITVVLFLGVYLIRMFNPDDMVVVFNIKEGLIYKLVHYLREVIL